MIIEIGKITLENPVKDKRKKPFPKLMITKDKLNIVLFSNLGVGMILLSKDNYFNTGFWNYNWDMKDFEDFDKPIIISNEFFV